MRRFCPFCRRPIHRQDNSDMFLRLVPAGFFVFEHRHEGAKWCQRPYKDVTTVEGAQKLIQKLGIA